MKIIVGLGNIGKEYNGTRHNCGFFILDAYADSHNLQWQEKSKFKAMCVEHTTETEKVIFIKPQTFYNNSGESVRAVKDFYKIDNKDILVIHDELALPLGSIRTRLGGSNAGNNGIKNISAHIGDDYWRIRIGIWNELQEKIDDADFVLSKFNKDELDIIEKNINKQVAGSIKNFLNNTIETTSFKL